MNNAIARYIRSMLLAGAVLSVNALAAGPVSVDPQTMARAFAAGGVKAADAANVQVMQAREAAAKSLGEDGRDLVFVPITPCTVWDTRFAASAPFTGAIGAGVTRQFYSHLDGVGGNFTSYGGNPACLQANETFLGGRPYAAMMIVYVNNPVGSGWLTFYRDGDPDPSSATISVYYSPGPTRTQTVISKSSRGYGTGTYDIAVTGRFSTADASASVVGYFLKPVNITLPASTASSGNILKGASRFIHNYGSYNTFIGEGAGNFTMTGTGNTANGFGALTANTTGIYNTAGGDGALSSNTTGNYNTANGQTALYNNTTGAGNTAHGYGALYANTVGDHNTANGDGALSNNTTGNHNTANGRTALHNNTTGFSNTASGYIALYHNMAGTNNTANGWASLFSNTTGGFNSASGESTLYSNTTGNANTAGGYGALYYNSTGTSNIALGYLAGVNVLLSNNIAIGNQGEGADSGTIRIGDGNHARAFIAGIRGVTTGNANAIPVLVDSAGQLGTVSSSRRFKDHISDMDEASAALMKLRPVTFHYKADQGPSGRTLQYGLIAEEVAEVYPGLVAHSSDGRIETVMYQFLTPMLLNEYQRQQRTIEAQAKHIAGLSRDRDALRAVAAKVSVLERQVGEIAELRQQMAHMARLLDRERGSALTAGLGLK